MGTLAIGIDVVHYWKVGVNVANESNARYKSQTLLLNAASRPKAMLLMRRWRWCQVQGVSFDNPNDAMSKLQLYQRHVVVMTFVGGAELMEVAERDDWIKSSCRTYYCRRA